MKMTLYKRRPTQPLKWLVAIIVFALALGFTLTDITGNTGGTDTDRIEQPAAGGDDATASAVPEPNTLILLVGGLSALYLVRRRRYKKK
jgi:hypothetical protein